jgi:hypothetical protein
VIRSPRYFVLSRTFLLGVGLTDLGHFGRYFGPNKEIVSVFNGSVVYFNVGSVVLVKILCPEVNMRSSHNTKTISIQICAIAREDVP